MLESAPEVHGVAQSVLGVAGFALRPFGNQGVRVTENPSSNMPVDGETKKRNLSMAVQREVAAGQRVESQTDLNAILVSGKPLNHVLHLILTLVTCGLWAIVWIVLAFVGGERRVVLNVDDYGNVLRQEMPR
jgi:hypothetical protein